MPRRLFGRNPHRPDPRKLLETIAAFINADTWAESRRILDDHPELLSDQADALLAHLVEAARAQGDERARRVLEQHRTLLRRCREVGVERAFAEKTASSDLMAQAAQALERLREEDPETYRHLEAMTQEAMAQLLAAVPLIAGIQALLEANSMVAFLEVARDHPVLLTDEAEGRMTEIVRAAREAGEAEIAGELEKRYRLLREAHRAARESGISMEQAIQMAREVEEVVREEPETAHLLALAQTLQAFINADTWAESRRILDDHPELLSDEADALLAHLVEAAHAQGDERARRVFEQHRDLLRRCREVGVERAFADLVGAGGRPPLQEILQQLARPMSVLEMPRRVELCRRALSLVSREEMPELWAALQVELGNSLAQNPRGDRAENLERAIDAYHQALEVMTREAMPVEWATTMNNLANAYRNRIRGDRAENLERAIDAYHQALEVFHLETLPDDHRRVQRSLARLHCEREAWNEVIASSRAALAATERLYRAAPTPEARQAQLAEIQALPALLAYALARTAGGISEGLEEAVLALERNRAHWLAEALALGAEKPPTVPSAVWNDFDARRKEVRELEAEARLPEGTPGKRDFVTLSDLLRTARERLDEAIARVREYAPDFMPEPTFADVQAAAADAPLVYLLATPAGGLALIVHADGAGRGGASPGPSTPAVTPIWLEGLTEAELNARVEGPGRRWGGYLGAYFRWVRSLRPQTPARERYRARDGWMRALSSTARWLGQVMAPLVEALTPSPAADPASPSPRVRGGGGEEVRPITLIPTGRLALLPLHAARLPDGTDVLDHLAVAYAPSAQALRAARRAAARAGRPDTLLAVDDPDGTLRFSALEVQAALDQPGWQRTTRLRRAEAGRQAVEEALEAHAVWYFSAHGRAGWTRPLESAITLADGPWTARHLLEYSARRRDIRAALAVLSACEVGVPALRLPEEAIGLPAIFLQAGVAGVVATLWSVNQISTALLMARFWELWRDDGLPPPLALREAQRWLRNSTWQELRDHLGRYAATGHNLAAAAITKHLSPATARFFVRRLPEAGEESRPFAHPFYWAAFTYTGPWGEE